MLTIKVPTRLAVVLGVASSALIAASTQLHGLSTEAHLAIAFALGMLNALGIHPGDAATELVDGISTGTLPPADGAAQKPQELL